MNKKNFFLTGSIIFCFCQASFLLANDVTLPSLVFDIEKEGPIRPIDVCNNAKENHPNKPLILLAIKFHGCDNLAREQKVCMTETYDLGHRCNTFVANNFATYHTRLVLNDNLGFESPELELELELELDARYYLDFAPNWEPIFNAFNFPSIEPSFVVIEVKNCKVLGISLRPLHQHASFATNKSKDLITRFSMIEQRILAIPEVYDSLRKKPTIQDKKNILSCLPAESIPLKTVFEMMVNTQEGLTQPVSSRPVSN